MSQDSAGETPEQVSKQRRPRNPLRRSGQSLSQGAVSHPQYNMDETVVDAPVGPR